MNGRVFVLVHGAYHGGWCWRDVSRSLRAAGHVVYAPSQTGLGDRRHLLSGQITMETFVTDVVNLLEAEELSDVVLVGHSFGGRTVTGVADRCAERIGNLCYLDAGIPVDGRSRLDSLTPRQRDQRIAAAEQFDGGLSVPPPAPAYFGITDPVQTTWLTRRLTPQPLSVEASALLLRHDIGNGLPCTYIRCRDPRDPGAQMLGSDEYARSRTDWAYQELTAAHDAMVSAPDAVAQILRALA